MNDLNALFWNPITLIAGLLALFFTLMAYIRRRMSRRARAAKKAEKPYRVSDPYTPPVIQPAPEPVIDTSSPMLTTSKSKANNKYFRQFGQPNPAPQDKHAEPTDYIWE